MGNYRQISLSRRIYYHLIIRSQEMIEENNLEVMAIDFIRRLFFTLFFILN